MVDNRGISPVASSYFTSNDSQANKMSEEKYGQGDEYFAQEMQDENIEKKTFQDRSAQLRASLNGLATLSEGSIMLMKTLKEKEEEKKKKRTLSDRKYQDEDELEEIDISLYDE